MDFNNSLDKASREKVASIIDNALENIKDCEDIDELDDILNNAINQSLDFLISEKTTSMRDLLESFHDTNYSQTRPGEILDIINTQVGKVTYENYHKTEIFNSIRDEGYRLIDIYYAKQLLKDQLIDYIGNVLDEDIAPLDSGASMLIDMLKDAINAENYQEIEEIIENAKFDVLRYYVIKNAKQDLEDKLVAIEDMDLYIDDLSNIVSLFDDALLSLESADIDSISDIVITTKNNADALLLSSTKDYLNSNLVSYHNDTYGMYDIADVMYIMDKHSQMVSNDLDNDTITYLFNSAKQELDIYYAKVNLDRLLHEYISTTLQETISKEALEIINAAIDAINEVSYQGPEFDTLIEDTKIALYDYYNIKVYKDYIEDALRDYHDDNYYGIFPDVPSEIQEDVFYAMTKELTSTKTTEELNQIIEDGKKAIDYYYAKVAFIDEMTGYYESEYGESISREALEIIMEEVKNITIDNFDDQELLGLLKDNTENLLDNYYQLKELKDTVESALRNYHDTELSKETMPQAIDDKIIDIVREINDDTDPEQLHNIITSGKDYIDLYYAKEQALQDIDDFYNDLTPENQVLVSEQLKDAKTAVLASYNDSEKDINDILDVYTNAIEQAKQDIISNSQPILREMLENYNDGRYPDSIDTNGKRPDAINDIIDNVVADMDFEKSNSQALFNEWLEEGYGHINLYYVHKDFEQDMLYFITEDLEKNVEQDAVDIINSYLDRIKVDNYDDIDDFILAAKYDLELLYSQQDAKQALNDYLVFLDSFESNLDEIPASVFDTINNAVDNIDNLTLSQLQDYVDNVINDSKQTILDTVKDKLRSDLVYYHESLYHSKELDAITAIIDSNVNSASFDNYGNTTELSAILDNAKLEIDLYIAKKDCENELISYITDELEKDLDWEVKEILSAALDEIDADNYKDLSTLLNDTKEDLYSYYVNDKEYKDTLYGQLIDYNANHLSNKNNQLPALIEEKIKELTRQTNSQNIHDLIEEGKDFIDLYYHKMDIEQELIDYIENDLNKSISSDAREIIDSAIHLLEISDSVDEMEFVKITADFKNKLKVLYHRVEALDMLNAFFDNLTETERSMVSRTISDAIMEVELSKTTSQITQAYENGINDAIDIILEEAKIRVRIVLEEYHGDNFSNMPMSNVKDFIDDAVSLVTMENFKNVISIEDIINDTCEDIYNYYLEQAILTASNNINSLVDSLSENDYSSVNWDTIIALQSQALNKINNYTDIQDVLSKEQQTIVAINKIKTLLDEAIEYALSELDDFVSGYPNSAELKTLINSEKNNISASTSVPAVDNNLNSAISNIKEQLIADEKDRCQNILDTYFDDLNDTEKAFVISFIGDAKDLIDAIVDFDDYDNINSIANTAIRKSNNILALESERASYLDMLRENLENLDKYPDILGNIITTAIADTNAATSIQDIVDIYNKATIDLQKQEELEDARVATLSFINDIMQDNIGYSDITDKYVGITNAVKNIVDFNDIKTALENELANAKYLDAINDIRITLITYHDQDIYNINQKNLALIIDIIDDYADMVTIENYDDDNEISNIIQNAKNDIYNFYLTLLQNLYKDKLSHHYNNLPVFVEGLEQDAYSHYIYATNQLKSEEDLSAFETTYYNLIREFSPYFAKLYVNTSAGSNDNDGQYATPFATLQKAIEMASDGSVIMLQTSVTISANIVIDNDITLMTADVDMGNNDITSVSAINFGNNIYSLTTTSNLRLQNITINGYANGRENALINIQGSENSVANLIILDGTTIQNAYRIANGGSAILAAFANIYMYGGEIVNNKNQTASILGANSEIINNIVNFYLLGGKITDNNAGYIQPNHDGLNKLVIGGDFTAVNNKNFGNTIDIGLRLPANQDYWEIRNDFVGKVLFNTINNPVGTTIEIKLTDTSGNIITGRDLVNIHPAGYPELYARYNAVSDHYYWDYHYEKGYVITITPDFNNIGQIANKAIDGDAYDNYVQIPALSADKYEIFVTDDTVYFTLKDTSYGDIIISVDYDDYLGYLVHNAQMNFINFVNDKDFSDDRYDTLIIALDTLISATNNVFNVENNLELAKDKLNSTIVKDQLLQTLLDYNKDNYSEDEERFIIDIIEQETNKITHNNYLDIADSVLENGKDAIDNYYLVKAKNNLKRKLEIYIKDVLAPTDYLDSLIDSVVTAFNDLSQFDTVLSSTKDALLLVEKNYATGILANYQTQDYSSAVLAIVDDALLKISNESQIKDVKSWLRIAELSIENQLEIEQNRVNANLILDNYLSSLSSEYQSIVSDIINNARLNIEQEVNPAIISQIATSAINDANSTILHSEKANAVQELEDFYNSLTAEEKGIIDDIINTAINDINACECVDDIGTLGSIVNEAIKDSNKAMFESRRNAAINGIKDKYNALLATNEYSQAGEDSLLAIKDAKIIEINEITSFDDINQFYDIKDVAVALLDDVKTLNQEIDEAKDYAEIELLAYLAEQEIILDINFANIIDNAVNFINQNNYKNVDDIIQHAKNSIEKQVAQDKLYDYYNQLTNDEQEVITDIYNNAINDITNADISLLDDIIDEAIKEINDTIIDSRKNQAINDILDEYNRLTSENIYNDASIELLESYKDAGLYAISKAENLQAVDAGKDKAIVRMQGVITVKETVQTALENYYNSVFSKGEPIPYAIVGIINEQVSTVNTDNYTDIDTIILGGKEAIYQYLLEQAKEDKIDELQDFVDSLTKDDYSQDNWQTIQDIIDSAKGTINNLSDIDSVGEFDIDSIINNIADIDTKSDTAEKDLVSVKEDKIAALVIKKNEYNKDNYKGDDYNEIIAKIDDAISQIASADSLSDIDVIINDLENELDDYKIIEDSVNLWWLLILLMVIVIGEIIFIVFKQRSNKNKQSSKTYSFIFPMAMASIVPNNAWVGIMILSIAIVALAIYIIYLFLQDKKRDNNDKYNRSKVMPVEQEIETLGNKNTLQDIQTNNTKATLIEEYNVSQTVTTTTSQEQTVADLAHKKTKASMAIASSRDIYNYSYQARLHLADTVTKKRYIDIKNHLLSYTGVSISESWGYERFMYRGKSVLKIRANVKSLNIFFNLNSDDYKNTKYKLDNVSSTKIHESTPSKYMVDGPRKLLYAKELIDKYLTSQGGTKSSDYIPIDYDIAKLSIDELIEKGLIKVDSINKVYENIIYS